MGLKRLNHNKKGFMFTLDALFASLILVGGLILISQHLLKEHPKVNLEYLTTDVLSALSELKMYDLSITNSSFVTYLNNSDSSTDLKLSVLEQIGTYWATNSTNASGASLARILSDYVLNNLLPNNIGINLTIQESPYAPAESLFDKSGLRPRDRIVGGRMITGIKGNVSNITGSTSSAYLQRIHDKRTSSFAYFGGFVGQGNITVKLEGIPTDVGPEDITKILIELDAVAPFNVVINGVYCTTLNPSNTTMTPESWDITFCNNSINASKYPGGGNITLDFQGDINNAYVMGGNIRVDYKTDELQQTISMTNKTYIFPDIRGVVNLYDSFYVPGNLMAMNISLHYLANHSITALNNTFYLTIGNTIVFNDTNSTTEQTITLNDTRLQTILDYSNLNGKTIPLRMGFTNLTYQTVTTEGGEGFGDIIVTTDVSGSMDWEFDSNDAGDDITDCSDPSLYDVSTSRISVARCVDKIFVEDVLLNTTLNRIGLVSYSDDTDRKFNLTNDQNLLDSEINLYSANGATCIACGITDAYNLLSSAPPAQLHKDVWKYDVNHQFIAPDSNWYTAGYDDSAWPEGNVPFGYKVSGVVTVLNINNVSANLWEYRDGTHNDLLGPPNDFSSGRLNSTRNTYGLNSSGDDGWDNKTGVYDGNGTNVDIIGVDQYSWWPTDYELRIDIDGTSSTQTSDGSYGIQFNVTQQMRDILSNGGYAVVSFEYRWLDNSGNNFENEDEAWVKARITNTSGQSIYLGSQFQCDAGHPGNDSTLEVGCVNNPDNDFSGPFSQDITSIITTTGSYYLDFGGKVYRNSNQEDGIFYFDNVQISFVSNVGNTYYRNTFPLHNLTRFSNARLYVASDNNAEVYLNGNLIDNDTTNHNRIYWNRNVSVNMSNFVEGDNILAAKLRNNDDVSGFLDIELRANMAGRQSAILIMSDGDANRCVKDWTGDGSSDNCDVTSCGHRACCPNSATGQFNVMCPNIPGLGGSSDGDERAFEQVINTSCYLHNKYNISIYSVAFGTAVSLNGTKTLNLSAACDNASHFYAATDVSEIADIYQDIASSATGGFFTKESQALVFSGGNFSASNLYGDSYISYTYTPVTEPPEPNEISVEMQTAQFNDCSATVDLPTGIKVVDAKVTSYSGKHWTRTLIINSNVVYNLTDYNSNYITLGDPYIIQAPNVTSGANQFYIDTGDDPDNSTGCSKNNTLIYTALVPSSTARSGVVEHAEGCNWTIQFEDNTNNTRTIPAGYTGNKKCSYTATNHSESDYDTTDAYDIAVYNLLKELDFDGNGKIFVDLDASYIEIVITTVSSVPYLWGPAIVKANVWQ